MVEGPGLGPIMPWEDPGEGPGPIIGPGEGPGPGDGPNGGSGVDILLLLPACQRKT